MVGMPTSHRIKSGIALMMASSPFTAMSDVEVETAIVTSLAMMRAFAADKAIQLGTAAFGFGGKAASLIVPRRRSSASLSARSSFSSGGT